MPEARIKFNGSEVILDDRLITCGRASDNNIAFPDDSNVSRYHAEIEPRDGEYWVIDLQSSNGTTVNGENLTGERLLKDGDRILLGGSSEMEFLTGANAAPEKSEKTETAAPVSVDASPEVPEASTETQTGGVATEAATASGGSKNLLLVAGVLCGLALLCVVGSAGAYYFTRTSQCDAKATITKPESGDAITSATEIDVEAENTQCVSKAVFTLDGAEIASVDEEPYTATIDPSQFPDLADGLNHNLAIVLIDQEGKELPQPDPIILTLETRAVGKPSPSPEIASNTNQSTQTQTGSKSSAATLLDIQQMTTNFIKQIGGGFSYNLSNKQLLQEVQKKIPEYAQEGYFDRASGFRDAINVAYVRELNLDARIGFILAMSRSKFIPTKQGDNEGLWQMSNAFVVANGYNGLCGTETLSDQSQNCAAKASALYMKAIINAFDGDEIYSAAAFGKSPADATAWKAKLPANRSDVWNVITTPGERDQLVRFLAAAVVTENPQKFGLKDRPLSELYRVTQ